MRYEEFFHTFWISITDRCLATGMYLTKYMYLTLERKRAEFDRNLLPGSYSKICHSIIANKPLRKPRNLKN